MYKPVARLEDLVKVVKVSATVLWIQFLTLYKAYMNEVEFNAGNL